jgi:integrase/recombinase XerD
MSANVWRAAAASADCERASRARRPGDKGRYLSLLSPGSARQGGVSELAPVPIPAAAAIELAVDRTALDRLPGTPDVDPFLRLAAAFLAAYPENSARAYRSDLRAWATWCASLGVHPLAARRHHADAWIRHLTTQPQPRTGKPASAATVARRLSAVAKFYDYAIHDTEVIAYSPVANVRRPPVSDESSTRGLSADELRRLLATATQHSPRMGALVGLLVLNGLRISEALATQVSDYGHDRGHRVLKITRKGGKTARVPLAPPVVRALDAYLEGRTTGPIFLAADGSSPYPYQSAFSQIRRLAKAAGIEGADAITPHSLRHSFATEALSLGAPLQDVQDALGHADPRTTRRYDCSRHNLDRNPTYLLATSLVNDGN